MKRVENKKRIIKFIILIGVYFFCGGCDLLLVILHKEMAEEKKILGTSTVEYNPKVKEIQEILREIGYNLGTVDGKLGAVTRGALESFQKDYGLKVSGYVDKKTWRELDLIYQANRVNFNLNFDQVDTIQIQLALKNAGVYPGPIDGKKGTKTEEAIKTFQKENGLNPDGIIGAKTWSKLSGYLFRKIE